MKKTSFNFNNFQKKAHYQDAGELMRRSRRHLHQCQKDKRDAGMSLHEAIESCLDQFQSPENFNYSGKNKKNEKK